MLEVVEVMRGVKPLDPAEAAEIRKALGLPEEKKGGWKRLFGGG
jgi:hypothetical protein